MVQAPFWVSDNVLLIRSRGTAIEGLLVDARDGNPISEAQIKVYKRGNEGRYEEFTNLKTNQAGQFSHSKKRSSGLRLIYILCEKS